MSSFYHRKPFVKCPSLSVKGIFDDVRVRHDVISTWRCCSWDKSSNVLVHWSTRMIRVKNYKTVSKFVTVMTKILWPVFFPDTVYITLHATLFQSYGVSLAIWNHMVLPATWHKWTHPALTLNPSQTGWYLIYLPLRDGRLSWSRWLVTINIEVVYPQWPMVTCLSTNPAVHGRESNSQPVDHSSMPLTITLQSHLFVVIVVA